MRSLDPLSKLSVDVGSRRMGETYAYRRRRDRFGCDEAPTGAACTLWGAEISATQIKSAAPSHQLLTSIPCEDASWLQGNFSICPFANPGRIDRPQVPIKPSKGEADALKGWFGGRGHAAETRRIDVLLVAR